METTLGAMRVQLLLYGVLPHSPKQSVRYVTDPELSLHVKNWPLKRFTPYMAKGIKRDRETKAA